MGFYATTTGLAINMIGTTFDAATLALASKSITRAENEVNKYLSKRYDLTASPFNTTTTIPPLVGSLTEDLAEGYMHIRMSRGGKDAMKRGTDMLKLALDNLDLISQYKLDLVNSSGSVVVDMSQTAYRVLCSTSGYTTTFDEDSDLDWVVDPDKLDDIDSERS